MAAETSMPTPVPFVQPEVKAFWDATAEGKLLLPKCSDCSTLIWFPRPFCPSCGSLNVDWSTQASGKGTIYSYTINYRGAGDLQCRRRRKVDCRACCVPSWAVCICGGRQRRLGPKPRRTNRSIAA